MIRIPSSPIDRCTHRLNGQPGPKGLILTVAATIRTPYFPSLLWELSAILTPYIRKS